MRSSELAADLDATLSLAIRAMPRVPRNSFYRSWIRQLIAQELPAVKYPRLRDKLYRMQEEVTIRNLTQRR